MNTSVSAQAFRLPYFLAYFFFVSLLSSCGNSDEVKITDKNFTEEIEQEQNLVFKFDKDLATDSLLGIWDTTAYLKITPAVRGKYKWTAINELTFSPAQPFAPSTDYVAELTENLFRHAKKKYKIPAEQRVTFHTPYLDIAQVQTYWVQNETNPAELDAAMALSFNYPVQFASLSKKLHVLQGEKELPVEFTNSGSEAVTVKIKNLANEKNEAIPVKLRLDVGVLGEGGKFQSKDFIVKEVIFPARQQMQISEVSTATEEGQKRIYIYTTQPVSNPNVQALIKLEPKLGLKVEKLENGLVVKGDFNEATTYSLTVSGTMAGVEGKSMGRDYEHSVTFGPTNPTLSFASKKGVYLSSAGARNLALVIAQVPRVKVTIGKIYENNILHYLREGKSYDGYYDHEEEEYYSSEYHDVNEFNGNIIFEKEYDTKSFRKQGQNYLLNLDLKDLDFDSRFKGLYVVTIANTDKLWMKDSKIVSVSDIGLIAKQGTNEVWVFANSIRTADVLEGVEVRFVSSNNQMLQTAKTDQDGVARFTNIDTQTPNFRVGLITARLAEDFNYMPYTDTRVNMSRFETGGKRSGKIPYDAFIYGDRDLYRPGDTVHVNTIVRTPDWKTVADLPVKIKLLLPNGKEYQSKRAKLNEQGAALADFFLSTSVVTGLYTLEVYSGNDVLLNSHKIGVEEFMPDRMKVTANLNKEAFVPGEKLSVSLVAQNLFGPPAANRNYEVQLSLKKKPFEARQYPEYNFSIKTAGNLDIQNNLRQGTTDAEGKGQEEFEINDYQDVGMLDGLIYTTVFDESGRPVNRLNRFDVSTQTAFFGIKNFDRYVNTRSALNVPLIALNRSGKPIAAKARVQLIRYTYESVIERYSSNYNYRSQRKENVISNRVMDIQVAGAGFQFTPITSGEYELRIMRPGSTNYVSQEFYAYGWGDTESTSFEVNTEGEVDITLDKPTYEAGDEAKILFKSPFPGKILVTVEQNKVLSYFYLKTDKKAASITLPIKDEYLPNIYITATALRQVKDSGMPLTIARGFMPLSVTKKATKLDVRISAPEVSRSSRVQQIKVSTAPDAEVTVAVVDEGILQIKDYRTPDPHAYFYQKRALEVDAFDLYPYLFPELNSSTSSVGGDGFNLEKRINPLTSKRVKLLSVWSGHLKANGSGEVTVNVKIPEFSGAVRIMAVAYKGSSFGNAEQLMRISDPVVISMALPRFVSPKDTIFVPVTLSNTTKNKATSSSSISVTGPLRIVGSASLSAAINPNSEAQVLYKLVANQAVGQASVVVKVQALGENFSNTTDITVRPAAPLAKMADAGMLKEGATATINPQHDYMPASVSSRLVVSSSPLAQFTDDITFLLRYPHGCLEQTTSTAFPLLYYMELAKSLNQDKKSRSYNPNYLVQEAITKIELMQQYNGGFSYWPGAAHTDWWSSAYATHFLMEAQKAGFPVSNSVLNKAYNYLQQQVKKKATEEYKYYDPARQLKSKHIASRETVYSLFVLSLAGKPDWATMNYYKAKPEVLSLDSRYMLASTYAVNGRRESFNQILPRSLEGETSVRALDGSFYSPVRDMALTLTGLLEADPDNPQVATLARHLSQELKSTRWYNTQERAFALLALGKMAKQNAGTATAQIVQNGKVIGSFDGKDLNLKDKLNGGAITIKTSGKGAVYYFWEVEGISQSGSYKQEDNFIQVRRTYFDRNGAQITHNTVKQSDLVIVRIALQSLDSRNIPNVAITDMLPAGFEIENPRLMTEREFKWIQNQEPAVPDYIDVRDDRINLYAPARPKQQYFFYQVRAVSKGDFQTGPVGAGAMYNAEYHSYHGAGVMRVR